MPWPTDVDARGAEFRRARAASPSYPATGNRRLNRNRPIPKSQGVTLRPIFCDSIAPDVRSDDRFRSSRATHRFSRPLAPLEAGSPAFAEVGYQLTIVTVLSRIKDSVNQLKLAMDITEGFDVQHVAVKNLYYGDADKFRFLERSKTKQRLLDNGGVVVGIRAIFMRILMSR